MIIQGSPEILQGLRGLNNQFGAFDAADDAVKQLYLAVLGREADPGGLQYFTDRFGTSIEPGEAIIFQTMVQAEIQARNAYLAQQMALSEEAAANARAIAAEFERKQNEGKIYFSQAIVKAEDINTVYHGDGSYTQYYKDGSYTQYYKDGSYETFGLPSATGLEDIEKAVAEPAKAKFTRGEFEGDAFVLPGIDYTRLLSVAVAAAFFFAG